MAGYQTYVYIYNNTGNLIVQSSEYSSTSTIGDILSDSTVVSAGITELSATIGGEMLSHNSIIQNVLSEDKEHTSGETMYKAYKYEDPIDVVTGFHLDGIEYKFEGTEYTASTGISISNNAISIDTAVVPRISTQANNVFASGLFIWGGTQTAYEALGTYNNNTLYFTVDSTGLTLQSVGAAASLMSAASLKGAAQPTVQLEPIITNEEIADDILDSALDAVDDQEISAAVTPDEANPESVEHMDEVLDIANDAVFTS